MTTNELAAAIRNSAPGPLAPNIYEELMPKNLVEKDDSGVPLVHLLALTGRLAEVKKHLSLKVLETIWGPGWTVAHTAAQSRCLDAIQDKLSKHAHLLHWSDNTGDTPVHHAAMFGTLFQIEELLKDPSRLSQRNQLLQTPGHVAALNSNFHQISNLFTPELLAQKDIQNQAVYKVAEQQGQIPNDDHALKKMVHRAKVLNKEEKETFEDILEYATQL